jgi:hypothetical protein
MSKARDLASAAPAPSTVSATELGYLDGVTSAIQTQVDAKIAKTLTTTTGDIIYASGANTPARLGIGSSAQVLTVAAGIPSWATPGGSKVVQIVNATYSTDTSSSSSTYADTGLTATITPTSASNKILVFVNQNGCGKTSANIYQGLYLQLVRGTTQLNEFAINSLYTETALRQTNLSFSTSYLDSPATTSATTYKTRFKSGNGTASVNVNGDGSQSTITLMEVTP